MSDRFDARYEPIEGGSTLGLEIKRRVLFDGLDVDVKELFDAPGERVIARCSIQARMANTETSWPAVIFVGFDGDAIVSSWAVQDELPWLQALRVLPDDDEVERRLDSVVAN